MQNNAGAGVFGKDVSMVNILMAAFAFISIALAGVMVIMRKKLSGYLLSAKNQISSKITYAMIVFTLCEVPAVFGFVLFLLSGDMKWFYIFSGYSLALFALFWPRGEELPDN
jgi:hypothetical protein